MKSNYFLRLIIGCFMLLGAGSASAAPISGAEAKSWADEKGQMLLESFSEPDMAKRYEKLDELFLNYVDLEYIGKFVMGKYWRQMTPEQQTFYQELFRRYALAIYKGFPLNFDASKIKYELGGARPGPSYTDVTANILFETSLKKGQSEIERILIEFRLHRVNGEIRLIDLKLAESSLILSYRSRFAEMIMKNDGDIGWFLEDLEMITASAEQTNEEKLLAEEY